MFGFVGAGGVEPGVEADAVVHHGQEGVHRLTLVDDLFEDRFGV